MKCILSAFFSNGAVALGSTKEEIILARDGLVREDGGVHRENAEASFR